MQKIAKKIDIKAISDFLSYDKESGLFTRINSTTRLDMIGKKAGTISKHGYIVIYVLGGLYRAHRVAWALEFGEIPDGYDIDHIDGNKLNNKISNLRIALPHQNAQNIRKPGARNSTGTVGVSINANNVKKKYRVRIKVMKKIYRKSFYTLEEASEYALILKRSVHEFCTI